MQNWSLPVLYSLHTPLATIIVLGLLENMLQPSSICILGCAIQEFTYLLEPTDVVSPHIFSTTASSISLQSTA